jgi:hypothetical protein
MKILLIGVKVEELAVRLTRVVDERGLPNNAVVD